MEPPHIKQNNLNKYSANALKLELFCLQKRKKRKKSEGTFLMAAKKIIIGSQIELSAK